MIDAKANLEFAMNLMSPRQRECFRMFYLEGKSMKEIGVILNISRYSAKNHVYRGRYFAKKKYKDLMRRMGMPHDLALDKNDLS